MVKKRTTYTKAEQELIDNLEPAYQAWRNQLIQESQEEERTRQRSLILRQLARRIGDVSEAWCDRVRSLSIEQIEVLGEALLDFQGAEDFQAWLETIG